MSASLESEAALSNSSSRCGDGVPKPCRSFNAERQAIQTAGERNELVSKISFGVGVAFTGLAGYLWYKEIARGDKRASTTASTRTGLDSLVAAPMVDADTVGGAAMVRF